MKTEKELTWTKMLEDVGDAFVSTEIKLFLQKTLRVSEFEDRKQVFERKGELPSDQNGVHIKTSHSLINFWRNLYLWTSVKDGDGDVSDSLSIDSENEFDVGKRSPTGYAIARNEEANNSALDWLEDEASFNGEMEKWRNADNSQSDLDYEVKVEQADQDNAASSNDDDIDSISSCKISGAFSKVKGKRRRKMENGEWEFTRSNHVVSCEFCGANFEGPKYMLRTRLLRHQQSKHSERPKLFKCRTCGKAFTDAVLLTKHQLLHTDARPFHCSYGGCNKAFKSEQVLKEHKTIHLPKQSKKTTKSKEVFKERKSFHLSKQTLQSELSTTSSKWHYLLRTHKCRLCHQQLLSLDHMSEMHGETYANSCPICEESDLEDVFYHLNVSHFEKTPLSCSFCSLICFCPDEFERHQTKHTGIKKLKCKSCPSWFPDQDSLDAHAKSDHAAVKMWRSSDKYSAEAKSIQTVSCELCGVSFEGPRYLLRKRLVRHQQKQHSTRPNLFKCHTCGKAFTDKPYLTKHQLVHTDARPFQCSYEGCLKAFKSIEGLKQHKTFHQEPKHSCPSCGVKFHLRRALKTHVIKCPANID